MKKLHESIFHAVSFDLFLSDNYDHHIVHVVCNKAGIFLFQFRFFLVICHPTTIVLL